MNRVSLSAPIDPTDQFASKIKALEAQVAELQRAASRKPWTAAWGEVGYQQITSDSATFTGTETDISGLAVAVTVVAGRKYKVTGHALFTCTVATDTLIATCRIGSTTYGRFGQGQVQAGFIADGAVRFTGLAAGSTTFKLAAFRSGTGTARVAASAAPCFVLVEDIGPA